MSRFEINKNIKYYNDNAKEFFNSTFGADMSETIDRFLKYLNKGDRILDFGCGSGRDSKTFIEKGFSVVAMDGSEKLCQLARTILGPAVLHMRFEEIMWDNDFDGVWACASLLHVPKQQMDEIVNKLYKSLKDNGVLYCSFKLGTDERETNERSFSDYDMQSLLSLLQSHDFEVLELFITGDVRSDRKNEKWINAIAKKK